MGKEEEAAPAANVVAEETPSCGFILASFATSLWQLYLTQGVLVGLGLGMAFLPVVPIASQWFVKKRSLTNGIVSAGSGTGGLAWSFATQAMLARLSAAWALRVIGVVAGAANLAAIAFVRSRNRQIQPTLRGFDARLLRR
ncbi:major facilitator superfamily protein [Neofusicoccum parvum]|uniref:Major facilitator superfamily protein n=1 Tax=Neofusicoccum parvum TaxID=310453 RepID=A0ACB5S9G2_9PEZI|nr:major facilitator superfamily protein [Neofusicoccum parvum]